MKLYKNGIGFAEIAVTLLAILILCLVLYPVHKQNMTYLKPHQFDWKKWRIEGEKKRNERAQKDANLCMSNLREIAVCAEMYAQDHNGKMPGLYSKDKNGRNIYTGWVVNLNRYAKGTVNIHILDDIFVCPERSNSVGNIASYAYNGVLLKHDGTGINQNAINKPEQAGMFCDSKTYEKMTPDKLNDDYGGHIIGEYPTTSQLYNLHNSVINIAYTDGHVSAVLIDWPLYANESIRAFYKCRILGLVNNPDPFISRKIRIDNSKNDTFFNDLGSDLSSTTIGGDAATQPVLNYACDFVKFKNPSFRYKINNFSGSLSGVTHFGNYIEGIATGNKPVVSGGYCNIAEIGRDKLVVIVSKKCSIKLPAINLDLTKKIDIKGDGLKLDVRNITMRNLQTIINSDGYGMLNSAATRYYPAKYTSMNHDWQLYVQNKNDGIRSAIAIGIKSSIADLCGGFNAYYRDGGTRDHKSYVSRCPGVNRYDDAHTFRGIYCGSDSDIINKVARDPWGIGIVSSVFVDSRKVDVVTVVSETVNSNSKLFPMSFQRILYAVNRQKDSDADKIINSLFINGIDAFCAGPWYKLLYYPVPKKIDGNINKMKTRH